MTEKKYDIAGVGSALLDLTVEADDSLLEELNLRKGSMELIDPQRSKEILEKIKNLPMDYTPGGSSANTIAGAARCGASGVFIGTIGNDEHGSIYLTETQKSGVTPILPTLKSATGHAITFITPDSERTFETYLGAAAELSVDAIDEDAIASSKILHLEGFLFEPPGVKEAAFHAMDIAKKNNVTISVDLSDPALIERIHDTFDLILKDYVDIVFVNEEEAKAYTGKEEGDALNDLSKLCSFAVVKLGARGSLIKTDRNIYTIPSYPVDVVNTNGAGDMYASGVLSGISMGFTPEDCGKIGSYGSSLVVGSNGARISENINVKDVLK